MKRIAVITMVRDEEFFLRKWVEYYAGEFGRENLYILFDGEDQQVPDFCAGTHTFIHKRLRNSIGQGERQRLDLLSDMASRLLGEEGYEIVVGVDCDEFLIVDPACGESLREFLSKQDIRNSISPLGIDIAQHLEKETEIDAGRKFLQQRSFGVIDARYTKASVISRPLRWDKGFHRVKGQNYHISPDLYLFHFGCIDMKRMSLRFMNPDRIGGMSASHFNNRTRAIHTVSNHEAKDFDKSVAQARKLQTWIRPIYSWNRPSMLGRNVVVEIPERFRNIL